MVMFLVIIAVLIVVLIKFRKNITRPHLNSMTMFIGDLGALKSTVLTRIAINKRRWQKICNKLRIPLTIILNVLLFLIPIINIIYLIMVIKNKEIYKIKKYSCKIYSTFPIWINKKEGFSYAINKDVFTWKYKIDENSIVVADELGYLWPSETQKSDPKDIFTLTWLRQATDSTILCASQSMGEVNITFRRKCNRVYQLMHGSRCCFPFGILFSKVQLREIIINEDVTNVYEDNVETRESNWYRFKYPKTHFNNRYGKNFYNLTQEEINKISINYQEIFKKMGMKCGDKWQSFYYEFQN